MSDAKPRWNRRKAARPAEIIDAAMTIFAERGFAEARLEDVARLAGVAKGTLYRYFPTKQDMFRAVANQAIAANLALIATLAAPSTDALPDIVRTLLLQAADDVGDSRVPAIARMIVVEGQSFPDVARIWHDQVANEMLTLLTGLIARAQAAGIVRDGDPRLHAFSILSPVVFAQLFREVFGADTAPDMQALAAQHAETVLTGLLASPATPGS